ncbi:MAG: futalosine hydrolase [Phycisphaerales bacterium]|nr:futalosine hydrolase [Phycisphaerales bacterium]
MGGELKQFLDQRRVLLAIAAPSEWQAVAKGLGVILDLPAYWSRVSMTDRCDAVLTGVGKANAAGACALALDPGRHALVVSLGIAGTLVDAPLCSRVIATACVFGDEGVATPDAFQSLASLGFPIAESDTLTPDPAAIEVVAPPEARRGPIACVSACSGTNAARDALRARTGAIAESMEGASVALVAWRRGIPFAELRVISNTCGDRATQRWDLKGALAALGECARAFA